MAKSASAATEKTIEFVREKETKNTVKFEEKAKPGEPPVIGTLYVQKWFVGAAETVQVTIRVGGE